jgi:hypothetical protein
MRAGGVEAGQGGAQLGGLRVSDEVELVHHDDVGEFDLVHEQVADGAFVVLVLVQTALHQFVAAGQFGQEVNGIDDGDHGVQGCDGCQHVAQDVIEHGGLARAQESGEAR